MIRLARLPHVLPALFLARDRFNRLIQSLSQAHMELYKTWRSSLQISCAFQNNVGRLLKPFNELHNAFMSLISCKLTGV